MTFETLPATHAVFANLSEGVVRTLNQGVKDDRDAKDWSRIDAVAWAQYGDGVIVVCSAVDPDGQWLDAAAFGYWHGDKFDVVWAHIC